MLSVRYRLFMASRTLQAKGEMCTLQTGKLLWWNQYQLRPCACVCAELQESSISRLSWSFVKESAGLFIPQKLRSGMHRISQQSYESYIILRDRIVELAWSKVSTKVCGFKFGSIKLHLTSKRIKEILTQKRQYNWKYLSQFNDKNGFRRLKKKSIYRFQLYA